MLLNIWVLLYIHREAQLYRTSKKPHHLSIWMLIPKPLALQQAQRRSCRILKEKNLQLNHVWTNPATTSPAGNYIPLQRCNMSSTASFHVIMNSIMLSIDLYRLCLSLLLVNFDVTISSSALTCVILLLLLALRKKFPYHGWEPPTLPPPSIRSIDFTGTISMLAALTLPIDYWLRAGGITIILDQFKRLDAILHVRNRLGSFPS